MGCRLLGKFEILEDGFGLSVYDFIVGWSVGPMFFEELVY